MHGMWLADFPGRTIRGKLENGFDTVLQRKTRLDILENLSSLLLPEIDN
jgi:hypothetical protein